MHFGPLPKWLIHLGGYFAQGLSRGICKPMPGRWGCFFDAWVSGMMLYPAGGAGSGGGVVRSLWRAASAGQGSRMLPNMNKHCRK